MCVTHVVGVTHDVCDTCHTFTRVTRCRKTGGGGGGEEERKKDAAAHTWEKGENRGKGGRGGNDTGRDIQPADHRGQNVVKEKKKTPCRGHTKTKREPKVP
jgi:hypothetical protein